MVSLVCGVFDRGDDVFLLKRRVVRKDFLEGSTRRQKLKDVGHTNAQPTNAGPPAAFPFLHRNPLQPLVVHTPKITCLALEWQGPRNVLPTGACRELSRVPHTSTCVLAPAFGIKPAGGLS